MSVDGEPPTLSDFGDWVAADYLSDYYAAIEVDEHHTLQFLVDVFQGLAPDATALAFGVGPTVHHMLALSGYVREIHAADFLPANLEAIRRWQRREAGAHDWRLFARQVLACEGRVRITDREVQAREDLTRQRIARLLACDAGQHAPVSGVMPESYDAVVSCYCAESATADKAIWARYVSNVARMLKPGGLLVMAALRRCSGYKVGSRWFPCANVDEHDVAAILERCGFDRRRMQLRVATVPGQRHRGYGSIVLASARSAPRQLSRASVGLGQGTAGAEHAVTCPAGA